MPVVLSNSKAKVSDVKKTNKILGNYELQGCKIKVDDDGNLEILPMEADDDCECWPRALTVDQCYDVYDEDSDEDSMFYALFDLYEEKGDQGFIDLLRELATCLETPLMILALKEDNGDSVAQVWRVQPGNTDVESLTAVV